MVELQKSVKNWIIANDGAAVIEVPVAVKIPKEQILNKLKSSNTISEINCE